MDHLYHNSQEPLTSANNISRNEQEAEECEDEEHVQFTVIGLTVTPEFQKCKYIVESLHRCYPEKFDQPIIKSFLNLDWNGFLRNERRSRGGTLWTLRKCVAIYYNGDFMGDDTALSKYVSARYILPMKNFYEMGRDALKDYFMELMSRGRRCIYLMIAIDGDILGSLIFMLYDDLVPKTSRLFLKRCKKTKGGYSNTPIHRIVQASWIQCGGYRLNEVKLPCENYAISHDNRGVLSMCNSGRHKNNTTQFLITLEKSTWMDTHYVAFGQLLHGDWVLSQIEAVPTKYQQPQKDVRIVRAGEFSLCLPRLGQGRLEHELDEFLDDRLSKNHYKNYFAKTELNLGKVEENKQGVEIRQEFLDSDLESHFPLQMLPTNIQEAFNYVPGKKSSCLFEVENCLKCGCSHDVGKCFRTSPSRASSFSSN
ncbi:hypothetical protein HHI36_014886 [Cryptolaemus montrouzieri]|uniref:PPIase cyclophilin-type domain-containing protein n=1 Tax=Cryptolaemus montrouzieri TaxID=559131 RepID=A0ABD2N4F6_9CUCU